MNRAAQIILYLFTGLIAFVVFLVLLFPLDAVIGHFLAKIEQETRGAYRVSVSEIDASLIFDTEFSNFKIYEGGKEIFSVPTLDVGVSLFSLMSSSKSINFEAKYKEGRIEGRAVFSISGIKGDLELIDVSLKKISLQEIKFLENLLSSDNYPIEFQGIVDGSIYMVLDKDVKSSEAEVNLKISQSKTGTMTIDALKMSVPEMELASENQFIEIDGVMDGGTVTLNRLSIPGPDFVLSASGSARLNSRFDLVRLSIDGKFAFSDKVTEAFPLVSFIEAYKTSDGTYPLSIRGSGNKPKIKIGDMQVSDMLGQ